MELKRAMEIVLDLARQGMIDYKEAEANDLLDQHKDQLEAIAIVETLKEMGML